MLSSSFGISEDDLTWLSTYGDHSFAIQGPQVWNSLPAELRVPDIDIETFQKRLKKFLFDTQ